MIRIFKRQILLVVLFALAVVPAVAQNIRGRVVDQQQAPISYAGISLISKADSTVVAGVVSIEDGTFNLPGNTALNESILKVSSLGFNTLYLEPTHDMGTIVMTETLNVMDEVTVKAKRPSVKMSNGKLKVNVEHTILSNTGNAMQVLSLMPFVSRSDEGVSVFGRGTPLIYIDNRKITDIGDLQKIQSNEIKSVETDLQPGVAYGSDVRAVVRITTIKPEEGLSASLTVQGNQTKHFNGLGTGRINYHKGNWDVFGEFTAQRGYKTPSTDNDLSFDSNGSAVSVLQQLDNMSKNNALSSNIGIDFSNNGKNEFGIKYTFTHRPDAKNTLCGTSTYMLNGVCEETGDIVLESDSDKTDHNINGYYITNWGEGNSLNLSFDYMNGEYSEDYTNYWDGVRSVSTDSHAGYDLLTSRVDLSHDIFGGILNYGAELTYTQHSQRYNSTHTAHTSIVESNDENKQLLGALFVSQSKNIGDLSAEIGARLEYADYKYYQDGALDKETSKRGVKFLPYLQIDYDTDAVSLSLSYNNVIHRPSYGQLNSSTVYVDKYTYQRGNPLLRSSYDYVLDLIVSWKALSFDLSHTWYENRILQTYEKTSDQSAVIIEMKNIPHYREWGATLSYTPTINFWRPKAEVSLFKQHMIYGGQSYGNPYFAYELDNVFRITKNTNLSFDVWGTARGHQYLSELKSTFRTDISINTMLCNNKLSLWLKLSDIFGTDKERWICDINNVRYSKNNRLDTRGVMLQARYVFNSHRNKYRGVSTSSEIMRLQ